MKLFCFTIPIASAKLAVEDKVWPSQLAPALSQMARAKHSL